MLSPEHRLRRRRDFGLAVRRGRRASRALVTVHLRLPSDGADAEAPQAGLVVSKAVGGSVVRSRVARRLRHQLRPIVADLPAGAHLVVRAAPAAAEASSADLGADLRAALRRVLPAGAP